MGLLELRAHLIEEARTLGRQFGGDGKIHVQYTSRQWAAGVEAPAGACVVLHWYVWRLKL